MSRSRKKTPLFYMNICSQKEWKTNYNRIYRRKGKSLVHRYLKNDNIDYVDGNVRRKSYADRWVSPSDGKWEVKLICEDDFYNKPRFGFGSKCFFYCDDYKDYDAYLISYKKRYVFK